MGIVNVTPDSFSDGGEYLEPERAVHRALHLIAEGADLVDLGAESTRPGSPPVPAPVQLARLRPVLSKLHAQVSVPISVDTRDPEVAQVALDSGADLINDVSGLRDPALRRVLARAGAPAILMHMRGTPETMQSNLVYADLIDEVYGGLARGAWTAIEDGVSADALLVDPGLGFGKSGEQNLTLLARADEFRSLGFPVAIGASRKAFLGRATGESDPGAREAASVAAAVLAANRGVEVVRAHDVLPTVQAVRLADAVRRGRFEPGGSAGRNRPARPSRSGSG
jgi:dihydropteroate synthase